MSTPTVMVAMDYDDSIRSREVAARFFEIFSMIYPEVKFDSMGEVWTSEKKRFDQSVALAEWEQDRGIQGVARGGCNFYGSSPAKFNVAVRWRGPGTHESWADSIAAVFDESIWLENRLEGPSDRAMSLLKELTTLGTPLYGSANHWLEFEEKSSVTHKLASGQITKEIGGVKPREGLVDIFWGNYFGKRYVELIGTDVLTKVKCSGLQQIGEGFLLTFGVDPFGWRLPEIRSLQESAKLEIDHGVFFDRAKNLKPSLNLFSRAAEFDRNLG